jgi:hypothetical protein
MPDTPADRMIVAQLAGASRRYARLPSLSAGQHHAAITELTDIAAGRADLLAQCAGLAVGTHAGGPDEELYLRAAQLCIDAGADQSQIPRWTREGHRQGAS